MFGISLGSPSISVKTDVGQVDLVSWLSDGTIKKKDCPTPFRGYFQ
jgi:hypothetical protein